MESTNIDHEPKAKITRIHNNNNTRCDSMVCMANPLANIRNRFDSRTNILLRMDESDRGSDMHISDIQTPVKDKSKNDRVDKS